MKIKITSLFVGILMACAAAASAADGKALFEANCAKCHGATGAGDTKMGQKAGCKDFGDAAYQATLTDAKMTAAIRDGVKEGDKQKMKPFAELSADDIKALVAHVKAFKK